MDILTCGSKFKIKNGVEKKNKAIGFEKHKLETIFVSKNVNNKLLKWNFPQGYKCNNIKY